MRSQRRFEFFFTVFIPTGALKLDRKYTIIQQTDMFWPFSAIFRKVTNQKKKKDHLLIMSQTCNCRIKNYLLKLCKKWLKGRPVVQITVRYIVKFIIRMQTSTAE